MKFSEIPYKRPNISEFEGKFNAVLAEFKEADSFEQHDRALLEMQDLLDGLETQEQLSQIRFDNNTTDKKLEAEVTHMETVVPRMQSLENDMRSSISKSKYREQLGKKYGAHLLKIADFKSSAFDPAIVEDLQQERKVSGLYSKLTGGAQIDFEGAKVTLPAMRKFLVSKDRNIRKKAYLARWEFFASHQEELDDIYDQLVKIRHGMAVKLGFDSYTKLSYKWMSRFDYDAENVANFRNQLSKDVVPLVAQLRAKQAKRLGLDQLEPFDIPFHFASGNPAPKGTPEEILRKAQSMYRELSSETGEFFDHLLDNELIDVINRPGKSPGGYCWEISALKYPYIFANFNGTSGDVDVLTHEAGHAFQYHESRNFALRDYRFPQAETAEIHSTSMEFLTYPWMRKFFQEDTDKYYYLHQTRKLVSLPSGATADHFQEAIYDNPGFTPDERAGVYREMQAKYSPDQLSNMTPYLQSGRQWQSILHFYLLPFYYIDYSLAEVCAFQFHKKAEENREETWSDYLKLCQAGGSQAFLSLLKLAKLRSPFDDGTVKDVVDHVVANLNKIDDSKF